MVVACQRGYVVHCLQGVPATWCATILVVRRKYTIAPDNCGTTQQLWYNTATAVYTVHCKSVALWKSCGTSTTVIGTLPALVRNAITGLFHLGHRMAKSGSPPTHMPGDVEAPQLAGGSVTPSYQSPHSVATIAYAIAAPILSVLFHTVSTKNQQNLVHKELIASIQSTT